MEAPKEIGLTQMLIVDPTSIYYLTGVYVEPSEWSYALHLRKDGNHVYFLDKLFTVPEDMGAEKIWYPNIDPAAEIMAGYLDKGSPLGADKDLEAWFLLSLMKTGAATGFVNSPIAVDRARGVKDEEEQDKMRVASGINDGAVTEFKELAHEGVTEWQVTDQMLKIYMDLETDGFSFEPLIVFDANTADPHHGPDGIAIKPGDSVLFNASYIRDGYCSDMARTLYFQKASDEHRRIYEIARSADETIISKVRPNVPLCGLGGAAEDLITEQGYEPLFIHRLGYLIGLGEHEFGDVSSVSTQKAEPGVIFFTEPGIYLSGDTGIRMEDPVLVTEKGCEVLNHYSKGFEIIG